jgi:hypothetical protein
MKYSLRTFGDILNAIMEELKIQTSDVESRRRIKRNINTVYLNHVVPFKRWRWLTTSVTLTNEPYFSTGTANVQQNVSTVVLTQNPGSSRRGYYFAADGHTDVYRIAAHAANSTTLTLETPFNGPTNTVNTFKIYTDAVPLPPDCKEVVDVSQPHISQPIQAMGLQELRRLQAAGGQPFGFPNYYTTGPFEDPEPYVSIDDLPAAVSRSSEGLTKTLTFAADVDEMITPGTRMRVSAAGSHSYNGMYVVASVSGSSLTYSGTTPLIESATADTAFVLEKAGSPDSSGQRSLIVYPSITNRRTNLLVDYQINVEELDSDADEPLMPVENRIVLFYGGMWLSAARERDAEWSQENFALMNATLARMAGKTEDTPERPVWRMSRNYLASKRRGGSRRSYNWNDDGWGFPGGVGGTGSPPVATGTPNSVAIFDENGLLIGSSTISLEALEFLVGAQGGLTVNLPASATTTVDEWSATTYKSVHMYYLIQRGSESETGTFIVATDGSTASYNTSGTWGDDVGIDLVADIFAGNIRVQGIADGTGPTATLSFRAILI